MDGDNVVTFDAGRRREGREPPLSDSELARLRLLLQQHACVVGGCPLAQRLLAGDER